MRRRFRSRCSPTSRRSYRRRCWCCKSSSKNGTRTATQHGCQIAAFGSAPAQLLRLRRARLAALSGWSGPPSGGIKPQIAPITALSARFRQLQSRRFQFSYHPGSGSVNRKEWHKAMPAIGIQTTREMLDVLFDAFDEDGSGEIEFAELQARLVHAAMHCTSYTLHTLLLHCAVTRRRRCASRCAWTSGPADGARRTAGRIQRTRARVCGT